MNNTISQKVSVGKYTQHAKGSVHKGHTCSILKTYRGKSVVACDCGCKVILTTRTLRKVK